MLRLLSASSLIGCASLLLRIPFVVYFICIVSPLLSIRCRTPGLHNKIPAHKIFARVWVAQESFLSYVAAKIFQGLGPKRRESCNGDRVYLLFCLVSASSLAYFQGP